MITLIAIAPSTILRECNTFAAILSGNAADLLTYRTPNRVDADGNEYCGVGVQVSDDFFSDTMKLEGLPVRDIVWSELVLVSPGDPETGEQTVYDIVETPLDYAAAGAVFANMKVYTGQEDFVISPTCLTVSMIGEPPGLTAIAEAD